jgi:hypothetical protein
MSDIPVDFYANAVNIGTSVYDITLNFRLQSGELNQQSGEVLITVSAENNIRMSPQHAKALAGLLVNHIKGYEKQFSVTLPLPDDIKKFWDDNVK